MPFDPSGNFSRVHNWVDDRNAGIRIMADRHDEEDDNFANALNQVMLRTGQIPFGGDLQMNGNKLLALSAGTVNAPAITFITSPNTGIYSPGAGQVGMAVHGQQIEEWVDGGANITGTLSVSGALTAGGLNFSGPVTGDINSTGNINTTGNMSAVNATFSGTLNAANVAVGGINSSAIVCTSLQVNGPTNTTGTISSGGDIHALGNVYAANGPGNGFAALTPGGSGNTGYLAFFNPNGNRNGYIGYVAGNGANAPINYSNENGGGHQFNTNIMALGGMINANQLMMQDGGSDCYIRNLRGNTLWFGTGNSNVFYVQAGVVVSNVQFNVNGNAVVSSRLTANDSLVTPTLFVDTINNWHNGLVVSNGLIRYQSTGLTAGISCINNNIGHDFRLISKDNGNLEITNESHGWSYLQIPCNSFQANFACDLHAQSGAAFVDGGGNTLGLHSYSDHCEIDGTGSYLGLQVNGAWQFVMYGGTITCYRDIQTDSPNAHYCGTPSLYWGQGNAGGWVNHSDERSKNWVGGVTADALVAGKNLIDHLGYYTWKEGMDTETRHFGIRAQDAAEVLMDAGVEPVMQLNYPKDSYVPNGPDFINNFVQFDTWEKSDAIGAGNSYSVNYHEMAMLMIASLQEQVKDLQAQIDYLKGYGK